MWSDTKADADAVRIRAELQHLLVAGLRFDELHQKLLLAPDSVPLVLEHAVQHRLPGHVGVALSLASLHAERSSNNVDSHNKFASLAAHNKDWETLKMIYMFGDADFRRPMPEQTIEEVQVPFCVCQRYSMSKKLRTL